MDATDAAIAREGAKLHDAKRRSDIHHRRYCARQYDRRRHLELPTMVGLDAWRLSLTAREGNADDTKAILTALRARWHAAVQAPSYSDVAHGKERVRIAIMGETRLLRAHAHPLAAE